MPPQLIFGTAGFGMDNSEFQDAESVRAVLTTVKGLGIRRLDSGARYPPLNPGRSEELIGEVADLSKDFAVDTKVFTDTRKDSSGDLTRENIQKSVEGSLGRLRRPEGEGINVLHIHRADPTTPLEEQIQAFNEQIELGHCKAWGVSNVPIPTLERIVALCDEHGWRKPSCYQAEYSIVSRGVETKLLPLLRAHGIRLNAFRSIASGLLTGNLSSGRTEGTRFDPANPLGGAMRRVFGAPDLVSAVKRFDERTRESGAEPLEVAVRWIVHHSQLGEEDGVLLGASKTRQVVQTVELARKGPLSEELLKLVDELWDAVKETRGDII
ncbi:putative oxidoreductase [Annulohypoxylon truncatum]|uniref:putative oxidoreductase n=1 Tax=Annulohypoxylon truncatum TaxID=327061 RepID=UPI00200785BF|nr:putative oxidoreductase [Annulohypoxylon truncatum]KAI1212748.1 putative oxidoreductase [Annulohypoxylon truncatum]